MKNLKLLINNFSVSDLSILKGAGVAFIIKILGAGTSFGIQIILARLLSLDNYGVYVYIMAWVSITSVFTSLGFGTSLVRFIPEYSTNKSNYPKLKGLITTSILTTIACGFLIAITFNLILSFINYLEKDIELIINKYFFYFVGIFVFQSLVGLFGNLEKGKKRMFMAHAPSQFFKHLIIAIGVYIIWLIYGEIKLENALTVTFLALILIAVWHISTIKNGIPREVFNSKAIFKIKKWLKVSFPLLLISGFLILLNQTDIIMLGIFSDKSQVGIYNVAYKVATLTTFVLVAVNAIAAPTISELYHQDKTDELQQFARKIAHLIFWPTLLISTGLIIFASFVLGLFGEEFIDGKLLLIILLFGQLVNACVGSVGYYLNMTGFERDSARVFGIAALINIIFNPIAIYFYGAVGAAIVTTITAVIWNLWLLILVKKKIGIISFVY